MPRYLCFQVSECHMKRIDSRIFNLRNLARLELSNNSIEFIPDEIAKLQNLSELRLAHNNLTILSPSICLKESLQRSLNLLDVSYNKIKFLPLQICELLNLVNLKIDNNEIEALPPTIGRLHKLQFISACNNRIRVLPANFMKLRVDSVDLFGNSFDILENYQISAGSVDVPSLVEATARSIRKYRSVK